MIKNSHAIASLALTAALIAAPTFVDAQNTCIVTKYSSCVPSAAAEYLGAGINYFGDPRQVVGRVLELSKNTPVHTQSPSEAKTEDISGSTFSEFADNLAVAAGLKMSYGGFKASVAADYNTSSNEKIQRNYRVKRKIFQTHRYYLANNPGILQGLVSDEFKKQTASLSGDEIIDGWGTHVVLSALLGAKFELRSSSSSTSKMSKACFDAHVKAKYNGLVGSGSAKMDTSKCSASNRSTSNFTGHTKLQGGDAGLRAVISSTSSSKQIEDWSTSTGKAENQAHVAAGTCSGPACALNYQTPIWTLIKDPKKSKEVEYAFKRRVAGQSPIKIFQTTSKISLNEVIGSVQVPAGWKILSGGARVNNASCQNAYPMLLTASYFNNASQAWEARAVSVTRGDSDYANHSVGWRTGPCPNWQARASLTTFAVAIKDPWDIWNVKRFTLQQNGNIKNIKSSLSVKVGAGFTLVGGGASVIRTDGAAADYYVPGLISASYPQKGADGSYQWVSSYTYGASSRVNGAYRTNQKGKFPNISAWNNWYKQQRPKQSLLFEAQATGIKSVIPGVILRPMIHTGYNAAPDLLPQYSVKVPGGCGYKFTGGGAEAFYNPPPPSVVRGYSPFMLTQSYPVMDGEWNSQASNDANYTYYYSMTQKTGNRYHNRYGNYGHSVGPFHYLSTVKSYAMTFQVEPVRETCN